MREIIKITSNETIPSESAISSAQGIYALAASSEKIKGLVRDSIRIYEDLAAPIGLIKEISADQFKIVYFGNGNNDDDTPLEIIYKSSGKLALFVVTIGERICDSINNFFESNDFAMAAMLDSAASEGVEKTAVFVENYFANLIGKSNSNMKADVVSRFSPGYCGWHVSGQQKLFDFLGPEEIGVTLNDSYLMKPLKSISGVFVAGPKEIFEISNNYSFCTNCTDQACLNRTFSYPEGKRVGK
jgi:hypothetical protein